MAKEAYAKAPQVILKWYESQLVWNESDQKKENAEPVKTDLKESGDKVQTEKEKGSAEVTSKPEIAKEDKPSVAKVATEEGGKADDAKKEKAVMWQILPQEADSSELEFACSLLGNCLGAR